MIQHKLNQEKLGLGGVLAPGAQSKSYLLVFFHSDLAAIEVSPKALMQLRRKAVRGCAVGEEGVWE